jgi:hypothetical protein
MGEVPPRGVDPKCVAGHECQLEEAKEAGWTVVSMKRDWKAVFPPETAGITAIDILLEPDATMLRVGEANNSRRRAVDPQGSALDSSTTTSRSRMAGSPASS